jgi:hypothetical protein
VGGGVLRGKDYDEDAKGIGELDRYMRAWENRMSTYAVELDE